MKLYQIIKLLMKHSLVLVLMPLLVAITVFIATKNEQKQYQSTAMIYTGLASGYNIASDGNERFDNYAVNNAFDNFLNIAKSRNTLEEVGIKLLAHHLLDLEKGKVSMNAKDWKVFTDAFPDERKNALVQDQNIDSIAQKLKDSLHKSNGLFFKKTLHTGDNFYSIKSLNSIELKRAGSGDMVQIAYRCNDPQVAQKTMALYLETVLDKYAFLKKSETNSAVKYFEEQLRIAYGTLSLAEAEIKTFREDNRIINYQEQTRYIAEKQEDAEDDFHKEMMGQRAAESARDELELKLKVSEKLSEKNDDVLLLKNELSAINTRLSFLEVSSPNNTIVKDLQTRAKELRGEIRSTVTDLYDLSHSIEGVPVSILLNEWLDYMLEVDKAKARVAQFGVKMSDMDKKYDKFAPLGSQLSKLERKVDVAERAYLEILHGLNQAKIKEQSAMMKAKLTVVDAPSLPFYPLPSNRKILTIASFLATIILIIGFLLILEFLNNGIRSAEAAEIITQLRVLGAIPNLNNKKVKANPEILDRAINYSLLGIKSSLNGVEDASISVISSNEKEGKSQSIELLSSYAEQSDQTGELKFLECDSYHSGTFSIEKLKRSSLVVWVIKANSTWGSAQKRTLDQLRNAGIDNIQVLINGIDIFWLDGLIGELPVKRTGLRRFIKRLARLELSSQKTWK